MENRRFLLAALLSAIVLMLWTSVFAPPPAEQPTPEGPVAGPAEEGTIRDSAVTGRNPAPESSGGGDFLEEPAQGGAALEDPGADPSEAYAPAPSDGSSLIDFGATAVVAEIEERAILEARLFTAEFTNRGAQLVSLRLKEHLSGDEQQLEMVKDRGSDLYPFALIQGDSTSHRLNGALFEVREEMSGEGLPVLRFRHRSDRGAAEKVFRVTPEGLLAVEVRVVGDRGWSLLFGPGLRNLTSAEAEDRFLQRGVGYRSGENLELVKAGKEKTDTLIPGFGLRWLSLEDNFFLVGVIPRSGVQGALIRPVVARAEVTEGEPRYLPTTSEIEGDGSTLDQLLLVQSSGEEMEILALFGAKRYSRLSSLPWGLEETVRWGWFGFLAKPLYYGLEWIYQEVTPNYGWAIVLITCLIKLLFFPLTHKSQESMGKMQELNPKIQAIRAKYRSKLKDKQGRPNAEAQRQMNEEVMSVYKSAGVNPAAGCLPLLLQMPVFFAFFRVLSTAVELRGAPWLAWITDLSVPDRFFILPIVMGVTSVAMQRMMPSAADAMQRRMMQMMPIVFTVFALYFPAGLVLYWVTNNLLTMAQQALLMKMKKRKADTEE